MPKMGIKLYTLVMQMWDILSLAKNGILTVQVLDMTVVSSILAHIVFQVYWNLSS
jgi:hypothetical protein